jgi:hypothetical protein
MYRIYLALSSVICYDARIIKSIVVLGTSHRLQGAQNYPGTNTDDPSYRRLVTQFISSHGIETIFEEASGCGPTDAQKIAELEHILYFDIDPHVDERLTLGLLPETGYFDCIDEDNPQDRYAHEYVEAQDRRENYWVRKMKEKEDGFSSALVICGFLHTLSLAFKLRSVGFDVESICYVPYHKLCPKIHAD